MNTIQKIKKQKNSAIINGVTIIVCLYGLLFLPFLPFLYLLKSTGVNLFLVAVLSTILLIHYRFSFWKINKYLSVSWIEVKQLPLESQQFLTYACRATELPIPRIGIIDDSCPNAFTFGKRKKPTIVLTKGLLQMLSPDEINAVIGHELGHIYYGDFGLMVMAAAIPMFLLIGSKQILFRSGNANPFISAGCIFFGTALGILYFITKLILLIVSRKREYEADDFAAKLTGNPNFLSRALLKITSGGAANIGKRDAEMKNGSALKANRAVRRALTRVKAASLLSISGNFDNAENTISLLNSLNWEMRNYWADCYEFFSTHPLTAKRITHLNTYSSALGISPEFQLDKEKKTLATFCLEVCIWLFPWLMLSIIFSGIPTLICSFGLLLLPLLIAKLRLGYSKKFLHQPINKLLTDYTASRVRSIPISIEGTLQFEDVSNRWSRLFINDHGNLIELKIPRLNFLIRENLEPFNLKRVTIQGWYKRIPAPKILLATVCFNGVTIKAKTPGAFLLRLYIYFVVFIIVVILIGLIKNYFFKI